jgi:phage tail sheath protein FI
MERGVWLIARQYLYEGITTARLNSCRDSVTEFLNKIKLNGGLNDFYVVCDTRNNTAETIDNNEMHLSVAAKPVKSAEFILMNFICTTQSANVEEVALEHLS